MNYTKVKALGKEMNKLEKAQVKASQSYSEALTIYKEAYDTLIDGLNFNQWARWSTTFERKPENVCKVTKSKKLLKLAESLKQLNIDLIYLRQNKDAAYNAIEQARSLHLVANNPYSWYELRIRKLNQTANTRVSRPNPAGLKLVG